MTLNVKDATVPQVWQVMGENFELDRRCKIVDYLGAGAYGIVCAVRDEKENTVVAIKKCKKIFLSKTLAKRTLREVRLLRLFSHENIVKLKSIIPPFSPNGFQELYVVFELMETDLAQIIRSPQKLKEQHTQYFTYQLLQALKYLHSANVVHRDIKPRNILVNADCLLKLADFGLARIYTERNDERVSNLTDYVTTRWYRAPEVIVGWAHYGSAVDMWAVGCIVAELIGRTPLFPGSDTMKQIELICRIMGKPDQEFIRRSKKSTYRQYMYSLPTTRTNQLLTLLPYCKPNAIDLLLNLLAYNPAQRFTAEEALAHSYIAEINSNEGLVSADCSPLVIPSEEFAFEEREITLDILRRELLMEVKYHMEPVVPRQSFKTPLLLIDSPSIVDPPVHNELTAGLAPAAALSQSVQQSSKSENVPRGALEMHSSEMVDIPRRYSIDSQHHQQQQVPPDLHVDDRKHLFQRKTMHEITPTTQSAATLSDRNAQAHHLHASAHQFKVLSARRPSYNTTEKTVMAHHQHSQSDKVPASSGYDWIHSVPTTISPSQSLPLKGATCTTPRPMNPSDSGIGASCQAQPIDALQINQSTVANDDATNPSTAITLTRKSTSAKLVDPTRFGVAATQPRPIAQSLLRKNSYFTCIADNDGEEYKSEFLGDFGLDEEADVEGGFSQTSVPSTEEIRRRIRRASNKRAKGDYCIIL